MSSPSTDVDARVRAAFAAAPPRIPVILGADRSGRTSTLRRIDAAAAPGACQYVDLERTTSTPERFVSGLVDATPFALAAPPGPCATPRDAADDLLVVLAHARGRDGGPATFLLDEWLELQTFEHFPGLRQIVDEVVRAIAGSPNRFVLTTRFVTRALRLLAQTTDRFVVVSMPPLPAGDIAADLIELPGLRSDTAEEFASMILALTGGRAGDVRLLVDALRAAPSLGDPVSALVACLAPGGALDLRCRYSYEFRLHRARGYGALKAILGILAAEEPLSLSEIAARLGRTPGSTRDYLWWLEDVDLVVAHRKQYAFGDPVLRLWVSLFDRPTPPGDDVRAAAVQRFALARLSHPPPAPFP
jgi:hypothetical protein